MIATRIAAALAAGALAVGILAGSAGTIVLRDATSPQAVDWTAMSQMSSMMAGSGGMMNGSGGMMHGAGGMMGSGTSAMPDWMQQHHVTASPVPAR